MFINVIQQQQMARTAEERHKEMTEKKIAQDEKRKQLLEIERKRYERTVYINNYYYKNSIVQ